MKQRWCMTIYVLIFLCLMAVLINFFEQDKPIDGTSSFERATVLSKSLLIDEPESHQKEELIKVRLETGLDKGLITEIKHYVSVQQPAAFNMIVSPGDQLVLERLEEDGIKTYYIDDFYRIPYFTAFLGVLLFGLIIFGRSTGIKSLIAIGFVLYLLWRGFIAQAIHSHINIYLLTMMYCGLISLVVLILVSGFTKKTGAALLGTWGGVILAGFLSSAAIQLMHLTGVDTEEAVSLISIMPSLDFQGILFASIIIGALGAILDVTLSIASAQFEIYSSNPGIDWRELYTRGMNVGKDMMGAMANTLILAYVGGSMPLLLMLTIYNDVSLAHLLNMRAIMTDVIRAIIGSIGLVYAIPLTAIISAALLRYNKS